MREKEWENLEKNEREITFGVFIVVGHAINPDAWINLWMDSVGSKSIHEMIQ